MVQTLTDVMNLLVGKTVIMNFKCGINITMIIENFGFAEFEDSFEFGDDEEFEAVNYPVKICRDDISEVKIYDAEEDFIHMELIINICGVMHKLELLYE
jgi:hypothetical protein